MTDENPSSGEDTKTDRRNSGRSIAIGLVFGVACGIFFGDLCQPLQTVGDAYVGLLQMTVLPYLVLSLIGKLGRLDADQARRLALTGLAVLLVFWLLAILLIVVVSTIFPAIEGASFYSPSFEKASQSSDSFLTKFVPTNVFRSLTQEYIPAVVVFCLSFGWALMLVPGKERLIDLLDLTCEGLGRINIFLVRLAPYGLFALTAAAAGTLRIDDLSRLQAYLIVFAIACAAAAFGAMPLVVTGLTEIRYRDFMRAAAAPILTAIATGKLFVVLPQIIDQCNQLAADDTGKDAETIRPESGSTASVLVPLAYPFPHVGKILTFIFVSFAAWYSGTPLGTGETVTMAATGAVSSFASPLISIPFLLDQHELPQDLMAMFILPGFITMRMSDVVGVIHLMALNVIVSRMLRGGLRVHWSKLMMASLILVVSLSGVGFASRTYLASSNIAYDLDQRLLSLSMSSPAVPARIYTTPPPNRPDDQPLSKTIGSTLDRLKKERVLRVGYHPDHLPYSFFNKKGELVGLDVELVHRLARRLDVNLEFIPCQYASVIEQLNSGQFDVVIGGVMITPSRLLEAGFSQPYLNVTLAIAAPDHDRDEFRDWNKISVMHGVELGALQEDVALAARRYSPDSEIVVIDSAREYFQDKLPGLDGLLITAEEGAAWNVLHPNHAIVIPKPVVRRPIGMAVRSNDVELQSFLDRWIDFERDDGSLKELRAYWIEGGGTKKQSPRWSVIQDVLNWKPSW